MGWHREAVQLGRAAHVLWRSPGPPRLPSVLACPYHQRFRNGAEQQWVESQLGATCSLEASGTQVWDSEGSDMFNQAHRKRRSTRWVRFGAVRSPAPRSLPRFMLPGNLADFEFIIMHAHRSCHRHPRSREPGVLWSSVPSGTYPPHNEFSMTFTCL